MCFSVMSVNYFDGQGFAYPYVPTSAPPSLNSSSMEAPSAVHHDVRMSSLRLPVIIYVSRIEFLIMFMLYVTRSACCGRRRLLHCMRDIACLPLRLVHSLLGTGALPPLLLFLPSGCGHPLDRVCLFVTIAPERRFTWVVVPYRCFQPFFRVQ